MWLLLDELHFSLKMNIEYRSLLCSWRKGKVNLEIRIWSQKLSSKLFGDFVSWSASKLQCPWIIKKWRKDNYMELGSLSSSLTSTGFFWIFGRVLYLLPSSAFLFMTFKKEIIKLSLPHTLQYFAYKEQMRVGL